MILIFTFVATVFGHGRLMTPISRVGHQNYENDPTGQSSTGGNNNNAWVCRHAEATEPQIAYEAGSTITLTWYFGAKHVGDCDVYLSYDYDSALSEMKWFKIANFRSCKDKSDQEPNTLELPSWLPAGRAVMRWGWYATHVWPAVEFYSQCADVVISSSISGDLPSDVITYPLIDPPIFPTSGYPNRFPGGYGDFVVGPPCAKGEVVKNQCAETASGTAGYIDVSSFGTGGGSVTPSDGSVTPAPTDDTGIVILI